MLHICGEAPKKLLLMNLIMITIFMGNSFDVTQIWKCFATLSSAITSTPNQGGQVMSHNIVTTCVQGCNNLVHMHMICYVLMYMYAQNLIW